jgi:hypothetical protein
MPANTDSGRRLWPRHPRLLHFLVAFGVAFPQTIVVASLGKLGASEGTSMVLDCVVYFLIGIAVGAIWCESLEGALTGWLGYSTGQFAGSVVFGVWNWFIVYALVSAIMALAPAAGELVGGAGRRVLRRRTK